MATPSYDNKNNKNNKNNNNNNNEQYGYDAPFIGDVPDELKCVICHLVLRNPLQIMSCGHRFCTPCFHRMQNYAQQTNTVLLCPVDREVVVLNKVYDDRGVARTVSNLQVKCFHHEQCCEWVGDLRDLDQHRVECQHRGIEELGQLSLHDENQEELKLLVKEMLKRLQKCEDALCAKDKDISHLKFAIEELKDDGKLKEQDMRLLKISNLQLQNEIKAVSEANLELRNIMDKENDEYKKTEVGLEARISELEKDMKKNENGGDVLETNKMITDDINTCKEDIKLLNEKIRTFQSLNENVDEHIRNLENTSFCRASFFNNPKQDIKVQWIMTNFAEKMEAGKWVRSPIFYTGVDGYCFQLLVVWDGPQKEELGMYLQLCRDKTNKSNCVLVPFDREYTFEIFDKSGGKVTNNVTHGSIKKKTSCL